MRNVPDTLGRIKRSRRKIGFVVLAQAAISFVIAGS